MEHRRLRFLIPILTALGAFLGPARPVEQARAIPASQMDPAAQCAEGVLLFSNGNINEALPLLESGFTDWKQMNLGIQSEIAGFCARDVGLLRRDVGNLKGALEAFLFALKVFKQLGNKLDEGVTLNNIGAVYDDQGWYAKALEYYQQALTIAQTLGDQKGEGITLNNIGRVYHNQGRYKEALNHYEQALVIIEKTGTLTDQATALNNIGAIYRDEGDYTKALVCYRRAVEIQRREHNPVGLGNTLRNIGAVYDDLGQYGDAINYYQEALTFFKASSNQQGLGQVLNNIGLNYHEQGRYNAALDYYGQALVILRKIGDRVGEGKTLNNIGAAHHKQGRHRIALDYYQQAMNILEDIRAAAGSEAGRAGFIASYADLYSRATLLAHRLGQNDLAFVTSERGRARAFLDSLATGYVQLSDQNANDLLAREQETYNSHQAIQDALVEARAVSPSDQALIADLEQQLAVAEQAHADAIAEIEQRDDELAALVPSFTKDVLDRNAVQQLLAPQISLISYYVLDDQTLAFVLTRDRFQIVELNVRLDDLVASIRDLREFANLNEANPTSAKQLYDWLIAPLKSYLTTSHLAIVPHSILHYLPFAALTDGERVLIDDYVLTVLPSASSLPFIQQKGVWMPSSLLVIGNPGTDADLPALPFAEHEARTIAGLYGVEPLLGAAATEDALYTQATEAGIVHLAAHASFNPVTPLASTIYLAPDEDRNHNLSRDGYLEVSEVYGLDLRRAELVVLSACETQIGELSAGDEVVGLTRAFIFAGTPSVIATLWSVDDKTTGVLMDRFYTHLKDGIPKAEALRQAQLEIRTQYPNPYYWAGFVLSGNGSAIRTWILPIIQPWQRALAGFLLVASWVSCIFVRWSRRATDEIWGYNNNQPLYKMHPRYSPLIQRLAVWGVISLPIVAIIAVAAGWYIGMW